MENTEPAIPPWLKLPLSPTHADSLPSALGPVTLEIWERESPNGTRSVVVCVDGSVVGNALNEKDGRTVFNWLQDAVPDLERLIDHEIEDLYLDEELEQLEKE